MNYFSYGRNMDMQKIFLETFYSLGNKTRQVKNSQKTPLLTKRIFMVSTNHCIAISLML